MEINSYTSNIQPYGSQGGTKHASKTDGNEKAAVYNPYGAVKTEAAPQDQEYEYAIKAKADIAENQKVLNKEEREKIVEEMNKFVDSINKGVSFRVDEESGREVVTVFEVTTGDIIRQIPDEEMLEVLRRLAVNKANTGLVVDAV